MKEASKLWWVAGTIWLITWYIYEDALSDLKSYAEYQDSFSGAFEGFMHGFLFDFSHVGRVSDRMEQLIDRAMLWRNLFWFSFLGLAVLGGAAIHHARQDSKKTA